MLIYFVNKDCPQYLRNKSLKICNKSFTHRLIWYELKNLDCKHSYISKFGDTSEKHVHMCESKCGGNYKS